MNELKVEIKRSKPRTPQANGRVEALNKSICSLVLAVTHEHPNWEFCYCLKVAQSMYK